MVQSLTTQEREEARAELRQILRSQHEIKTIAEYRGSTAYVRLFILKKGELIDITNNAGVAMAEKTSHTVNQPYGFKRGGYGYGKEFDVVYSLGRTLYPKGYGHTLKNCHSNDHSNGVTRNWHKDGGYRFKQTSI